MSKQAPPCEKSHIKTAWNLMHLLGKQDRKRSKLSPMPTLKKVPKGHRRDRSLSDCTACRKSDCGHFFEKGFCVFHCQPRLTAMKGRHAVFGSKLFIHSRTIHLIFPECCRTSFHEPYRTAYQYPERNGSKEESFFPCPEAGSIRREYHVRLLHPAR